jgi:tRNA(fMet)-specific endonuclease VapC
MLVLDTDVFTIIQRAEGDEYDRLIARLPENDPQSVHVTILSFEEQTRGWLTYVARARSLERQIEAYARLRALLREFANRQVLDFDDRAAQVYQQLVKARVRISTMDLKIAAVALAHGATLLSRNLRDYRKVPGLQVEDWTAR